MFWTIVITTLVNWLIMAVIFYWTKLQNSQGEAKRLRSENVNMDKWIKQRMAEDQQQQLRQSYNQGLYDGRETDTLYRQMLKKFQNGDQVELIINGMDRESADRNRRAHREG